MEGVEHGGGSSQVVCSDGTRIPGCMVLDATGHARKLVEYDKPFNPGFQVTMRHSRRSIFNEFGSSHRCGLRVGCRQRHPAAAFAFRLSALGILLPLGFLD